MLKNGLELNEGKSFFKFSILRRALVYFFYSV